MDWRFAVVRIASGFTLTPLLGWILILTGFLLAGRKKLLRKLGWGSVLLGSVVVLLTGWHALDAVELWSSIAYGQRDAFVGAAMRSSGKLLSVAVVLLWLGVAIVGVPPELEVPEKEERDRGEELYVGPEEDS